MTARSLIYLLVLIVTTVLYSVPIGILGWFVPYPWLARVGKSWGRINLKALELICGLSDRAEGLEHLPSQN
ncbi:MAG: hypothetical protein U9Q81_01665 [Pseudomonadota bacterium]|nr:hypothetical protein [Pseudomonadota bacterium]